ncbi:MAG: SHOCT domain-containing protein [Terriglobia bacterium]
MHWDGWWQMGWMWVFWVLVIVALFLFVRWITISARDSEKTREPPEEILKSRYARGEIDKEEYERRLHDLRR